MLKTKLLKTLDAHKGDNYHFAADRKYHTPEEIMDIICEVIDNADDEISEADNLRDNIMEYADSATPVYNHDLAEWFSDNWQAYDEIADELGKDGMGDNIMRGIMTAYCLTLEHEAGAALDVVWNEAEEMEEEDAAEAGKEEEGI